MSPEEASFVLYNNRSVEGVVANFMPSLGINPYRVLEIESKLEWCSGLYGDDTTLLIDKKDLDLECEDLTYGPDDVAECTQLVKDSIVDLHCGGPEYEWLYARGIVSGSMLDLGSLSYIVKNATDRQLDVLGITRHPMLANLFEDGLEGGGVVIPLFEGLYDKLLNVTTRRISDVGKLKYTQACPDVHVWGPEEAVDPWLVEGLFDRKALEDYGLPAYSVSSAMWSPMQLAQILDRTTGTINIWADNDRVGLRSAAVLKRFFGMFERDVKTWVSKKCKDPAEHFYERSLSMEKVKEVDITRELIGGQPEMEFNFTKYLKNRKF